MQIDANMFIGFVQRIWHRRCTAKRLAAKTKKLICTYRKKLKENDLRCLAV